MITSGSLPPGLAFQSDGCIIKGTPTAAGSWGGTMSMSVAGYKGSLSSSFGVTVLGPELRAATDSPAVTWGVDFVRSPFLKLANYTPSSADSVSHELIGPLPSGVSFDAATNTLSGRIQSTAGQPRPLKLEFWARATLVRNGNSYVSPDRKVEVSVLDPGFWYSNSSGLGQCCEAFWAQPVTLPPNGLPPTATATYQLWEGPLPAGFAFDSTTGVVSGTYVDRWPPTHSPRLWIKRTAGLGLDSWTSDAAFILDLKFPAFEYADFFNPLKQPRTGQPYVLPVLNLKNMLPGDTYHYTVVSALGAPVPAWLALDATTGTLSGVPTAPGRLDLQIFLNVTRNGVTESFHQYVFAVIE